MKTIGITGNFCSGKDAVANFIAEKYGLKIIDADVIAKEIISDRKEELDKFGKDIVINGKINPDRLFNKIFFEKESARAYNRWIHPLVEREMQKRLIDLIDEKFVLINAALLFEARIPTNYLILVECPNKKVWNERVIKRCLKNDIPLKRAETLSRLQFSEELKGFYCDFAIDNSGSFKETEEQTIIIINKIMNGGK